MEDQEKKQKNNKRMNDWKKNQRDRINFLMPKGHREKISAAADAAGISSAEFIRRAIDKELKAAGVD